MFVTVRYGDDKEQIFNPDCRNDIFLRYIRARCHCKNEDVVELCDERGVIKNLRYFPQDYAKTYLRHRETLILLRVQSSPTLLTEDSTMPDKPFYTPLLSGLPNNQDFMDTLNPPKDEDTVSELSSKSSRRRSSTFEMEDLRNNRSKGKMGINHAGKKTSMKRGQRGTLRKSTNIS